MFTGLIQKVGKLVQGESRGGGGVLTIGNLDWETPLVVGESIAVQGACLTLTGSDDKAMRFDVLAETFDKTCLGQKGPGASLNLERSLRLGDAMGGHIVSGHVDGVGTVKSLDRIGSDWRLTVKCDVALANEMIAKGSVACDGVSLTIVDLGKDFFSVHIIPQTWKDTSFRELKKGDSVNLETDMLGKYVRRFLETDGAKSNLTMSKLRNAGFGL